jgi:hypothetical protein
MLKLNELVAAIKGTGNIALDGGGGRDRRFSKCNVSRSGSSAG